jgi:putative flippase GtrA
VTNKLWVFQSKSWAGNVVFPELGKFLSSRVATGIFEMVAVPALVAIGLNQTIFGIDGMVSKVVVSVAVIVLNYILSKLFVFKK